MSAVTVVNEQVPRREAIRFSPRVVRNRIEALLEAGYTVARLANETGLSRIDVKSWMAWDSSEEVEGALAEWLAELEKNARENEPGWFEMPTGVRIFGGFEQARTEPSIFVCSSAAGCGKTTAMHRYAETGQAEYRRQRAVFHISAKPMMKSLPAVLEALTRVTAAGAGHAYRTVELFEAIARRVTEGSLIIIDEAQHLEYGAIEGMRSFLDDFGVGLAFLGNEKTFKDFSGSGHSAKFAQLSSRVGARLMISAPTEADIDAMLEAWVVKGSKEREFMQLVGMMPGALRNVHKVIKQARELGGTEILFLKSAAKYIGLGGV